MKYKHQQAMKKDWSIEQWKSSSDPLDRLIWFISIQSPHNWWRSRGALDEQLSKKEEEVRERLYMATIDVLDEWWIPTHEIERIMDYIIKYSRKPKLNK